jgi:hypothetical protein
MPKASPFAWKVASATHKLIYKLLRRRRRAAAFAASALGRFANGWRRVQVSSLKRATSSDHALFRIAAAAKRRQNLDDDAFRVEARAGIEFLRLVMIEKTVGQHHRPEF